MNETTDEFSERPIESIDNIEIFLKKFLQAKTLIDLGCGSGNIVNWFRQKGVTADGITYQKKEVENAKRKFDIDLIHADLHKIPLDDSSYDNGLMWDVLEHTLAPLIVLREASRVIKQGGKLLLFMPGEYWQHNKAHILCLKPSQIANLCNKSKWCILSVIPQFQLSFVAKHGHPLFQENFIYELQNIK